VGKRLLLVVGGLIVIALFGAAAWYLASPLFINRAVDEAFPFEAPSKAEMAGMSEAERQQMEAEFQAAIPGEEMMAQMPADDREAVEQKVMEVAAAMPDHTMDEPMPDPVQSAGDQPVGVFQGQFMDGETFHKGSGQATIYQLPDGGHVLRFEDLQVTNGPDLHVLLAANPAPANSEGLGEYIDLGKLKGNLGNQNYDIPAGTDLSRYQSVVIYCKPFHVVFATATLRK
jgi:hypothetical protein